LLVLAQRPNCCQPVFIQYIRNYPPHLEPACPSATRRRVTSWWKGTHLIWTTLFYTHQCSFTDDAYLAAKQLKCTASPYQ